MRSECIWILFLILPSAFVWTWPVRVQQYSSDYTNANSETLQNNAQNIPKQEVTSQTLDEKVISVRITSSVAVERGKTKKDKVLENKEIVNNPTTITVIPESTVTSIVTEKNEANVAESEDVDVTSALSGANLEFIKQLHSKMSGRHQNIEINHPFASSSKNLNEHEDSIAESSVTSIFHYNDEENVENVPLARSLSLSPPPQNYLHSQSQKKLRGRTNSPILTTVSFNIVHDTPKTSNNYHNPNDLYSTNNETTTSTPKLYEGPKIYSEPAKIYSQPSQVYSEPAKIYSEPAKIYSEPAKIYSEPAKIYSEPAKIYSEPAKFYSEPASLHLPVESPPSVAPWLTRSDDTESTIGQIPTTPVTTMSQTTQITSTERDKELPEKNYEVDEKVSVLTDGRSHGVQNQEENANGESCKQENCKVGYVVEGRQYRKYRVEERTSDGFIVGEYGVVRNEDGALRGVRYTADSEASPRLIYDALMKFLQLK